ncbi:MAG TPA: penicillin-binding protein 2 [Bacteroidales bacterium]|nr:penicillin-binding protein 2 [Bacteroidales bacterium]
MINDKYYYRHWVIMGIITAVVILYVCRLFYLQIIEDKYRRQADSNALVHRTKYAPRGLIYDRHGQLLVFNQPAYDIVVTINEMSKTGGCARFCRDINIDWEYYVDRMSEIKNVNTNRGYSRYTPQIFMTQLRMEDIAQLQEVIHSNHPGFAIQHRTLRDYTYPNAAQVLGSIGEVSQNDIEKDDYYARGDYAGRDGLEYTYEKDLRGEKGEEILLRNSRGRIVGNYAEGKYDSEPKAGTDITLTLDIQLQILAENMLQGKIGSIVAIEPATGEILALASSPTWDPALLVGRQRSKNYNILSNDPTKPLMNRALQAQYSPGSTFKTVQACVALQLEAITPNTTYPCSGPGSAPIKCTHHHGSPVSLLNAIEQSCNPYFWLAYKNTIEKKGYGKNNKDFKAQYNRWRDCVMSFGLGHKFDDSDLYQQSRGSIPSAELYDKWYGATGWKAITIRSNSIGQGEVQITPLQIANAAATIANAGYYITPHLNKADSMLTRRHDTKVDKNYFRYVQEGMWRVFEYGTGRHHKIPGINMCGKTGTVDNNHGRPHSLFIGFAPKENPKIAVAVVVENAGYGATWAAPMASLIMEQYLTDTIARQDLKQRMVTSVTNPNVKKYQ